MHHAPSLSAGARVNSAAEVLAAGALGVVPIPALISPQREATVGRGQRFHFSTLLFLCLAPQNQNIP